MINRHPNLCWRRVLRVSLCYVVAIQAFLSAFETTIAATGTPDSDAWLVICHGIGGSPPGGLRKPGKIPLRSVRGRRGGIGAAVRSGPAAVALLLPAGLVPLPALSPSLATRHREPVSPARLQASVEQLAARARR